MNRIRDFLLFVSLFLVCMFPWCANAEIGVYKRQTLGGFSIYAIWASKVNFPASLFFLADAPKQKIDVPDPVRACVNVFLFESEDGIVMIDAGDGPLQGRLENLSITPSDISHIMLTHVHPDHIGSLLGKGGEAIYEKAQIHLSKQELDSVLNSKGKTHDSWSQIQRAYGERIHTFSFDEKVVLPGGLVPIAAPGHTLGHTVYMKLVEKSERQAYFDEDRNLNETTVKMEQKIYFVGDIAHSIPLQFTNPIISCKFDADPVLAAESRGKILTLIARGTTIRLPVGNRVVNSILCSSHASFPGIGAVVISNQNSFIFVGDEL